MKKLIIIIIFLTSCQANNEETSIIGTYEFDSEWFDNWTKKEKEDYKKSLLKSIDTTGLTEDQINELREDAEAIASLAGGFGDLMGSMFRSVEFKIVSGNIILFKSDFDKKAVIGEEGGYLEDPIHYRIISNYIYIVGFTESNNPVLATSDNGKRLISLTKKDNKFETNYHFIKVTQ